MIKSTLMAILACGLMATVSCTPGQSNKEPKTDKEKLSNTADLAGMFPRDSVTKKLEFLCFSLNYGFSALFVEQPPALPGPILNCAW